MMATPQHVFTPVPFPKSIPAGFEAEMKDEPEFDPKAHLQLELPEYVVTDQFETIPFSEWEGTKAGLGYTAPFRVLSDEGIAALKSVARAYESNGKADDRLACKLRGLGYRSKFIRDFNRDPQVAEFLGKLAHQPVTAHSMPMNYSHTNFGAVGGKRQVDQWHVDSVPYVVVLIASDISGMVGGELQVINLPKDEAFARLEAGDLPKDKIATVSYRGAGYGIFMQGSKICHHVTAVVSGKEARISVVNSFMPLNPFAEDTTRFHTFKKGDPAHVSYAEYARHKAWRTAGQLDYLMKELEWSETPQDKQAIVDLLTSIRSELDSAIDLISEQKEDVLGYFKEDNAEQEGQTEAGK